MPEGADGQSEWQRWTAAATTLAQNPEARVLCPRNLDGFLEVTDVTAARSDARRERYLRCPRCGASNIILNPAGS
jgi:hypothetical protein